MNKKIEEIQKMINDYKKENPDESVGELSDTYHSFNDLYKHRVVLTALAFRFLPYAWKARKHEDGSMFDGMFVVGAPTPEGMVTYHYDNEYWDLFKIPEVPCCKFDGHTPEDVIDRLTNFINNSGAHLMDSSSMEKIKDVVIEDLVPYMNPIDATRFFAFYN